MSPIGYTVIEPDVIGLWHGLVKNREMVVALLSWLAVYLQAVLINQDPGVKIEVIRVEYMGAYAAIGAQFSANVADDIEDQIEVLVRDRLEKTPVHEFLAYVFEGEVDWTEFTRTLLQ